MAVQAGVAARRARAQVGRVVQVLVERERPEGGLAGRTATQAPEIDGEIRLVGTASPGDLVGARVTGADTYDLLGEIVVDDVDRSPARP